MIVDAHTHIFPPSFIASRTDLLREEPVFAELYAAPQARMASVADLLTAMDEAGVDYAVITGFAWQSADRCRQHNDELLEAAASSNGRLIAFCSVPATSASAAVAEMRRCAEAGARGFGELRPDSLGVDLADHLLAMAMGDAACALDLPLLIHASEPVGHDYPGKTGGSLSAIWRFLEAYPDLLTVLAHLGGGLPLYAHMPEVRAVFTRTYVDTAAVPWLYAPTVYRAVIDLVGGSRLLFGSDYPLRHPSRDLDLLRTLGLGDDELAAVIGGNAAHLLGLMEAGA